MLCSLEVLPQMTLDMQPLIASAPPLHESYNRCLSLSAGPNRLTTAPSLSGFLSFPSVASSRKQATRLMLSQRTMQGSVCDNGKHIGCVLVSRQRLVFMSPRTFIPVARAVLWSYPRILPSMLFIWQPASVKKELMFNGRGVGLYAEKVL